MAQGRYYIDCAEFPGSNCTLRISGTKDEVFKAAVQHAVSQHGYGDDQDTRNKLQSAIKEETGQPVRQPANV